MRIALVQVPETIKDVRFVTNPKTKKGEYVTVAELFKGQLVWEVVPARTKLQERWPLHSYKIRQLL